MNSIIAFILAVLSAYLIGSFPTSFILAKVLKGVDIRQAGSKNAGATNVLRVVGKVPAVITLVVDVLKGVIVVTLVADYFYSFDQYFLYEFYRPFLGLVVIAGHIWSVFLGFRGGKGVATTIGVAAVIAPIALIPTIMIWLAVFFLTNFVSLASIVSLLIFPVIACACQYPFYTIFFSVIICFIVIWKHSDNISRLLKGEENKTVIFKPK